jgi:hypothetical protein
MSNAFRPPLRRAIYSVGALLFLPLVALIATGAVASGASLGVSTPERICIGGAE